MWQRLDDASGEVTVSLKHQKIVKVAQNGTMTLDAGGHKGVSLPFLHYPESETAWCGYAWSPGNRISSEM